MRDSDPSEARPPAARRGLSRRHLLRGAAWLTAGVPAVLLLEACSGQTPPPAAPSKPAAEATTAAPKPAVQAATATPATAKPAAQAPAATAVPAVAPKPVAAGPLQDRTLRVRLFEDLTVLDPASINSATDTIITELIANKLLYKNPNTGQFDPDLAESWSVSPDGKTYTFMLRSGVLWHKDYGEFTSADVKFSFERIMDKANGSQYFAEFEPVASVMTPDPRTVVITMKNPYPAFISTVVTFTPGYIVNRRAIEEMKDKYISSPIGTGPYEFVRWTPGTSVELKAFDKYFGPQQTVRAVTLIISKSDEVAEVSVEKGDIDIAYVHGPEIQQRVVGHKDLKYDIVPGPRVVHLQFNLDREPFGNQKLRQALHYATDRPSLVKYVLLDQAVVANTFLNPNMFAYDDTDMYPYDPDKAKALLAEAGFANGLPKPIEFLVGIEQEYVDVTTAVQQQWEKVGIKTTIASVEAAVSNNRRRSREFDINVQALARFEPSQYLLPYASSAGLPNPNIMGYKGADEFIMKAVVEADEAKRKDLYIQAQRQIKQDVPLIPLYYPNFMIAIRADVEGAKASPVRVYNVRDIRFKE